MKKQKIIKFTCGVMSTVWEVEAESADIAVCASYLYTKSMAPIAIYGPEGYDSQFAFMIDNDKRQMKAWDAFFNLYQEEIKRAYDTIKQISKPVKKERLTTN